jgi:hypothetical protein
MPLHYDKTFLFPLHFPKSSDNDTPEMGVGEIEMTLMALDKGL